MDHSGHDMHMAHTGADEHAGMAWLTPTIAVMSKCSAKILGFVGDFYPGAVVQPFDPGLVNFSLPAFPGSTWITPVFAVIVFAYGGIPFLKMAVPKLQNRKPGMMTLISLAIGVAFFYSLAALFLPTGKTFFWELVSLIDIMLLGHWIEMRSVRQASGALKELAKLMPDTADRIKPDGGTETVSINELHNEDLFLSARAPVCRQTGKCKKAIGRQRSHDLRRIETCPA